MIDKRREKREKKVCIKIKMHALTFCRKKKSSSLLYIPFDQEKEKAALSVKTGREFQKAREKRIIQVPRLSLFFFFSALAVNQGASAESNNITNTTTTTTAAFKKIIKRLYFFAAASFFPFCSCLYTAKNRNNLLRYFIR